MSTTTRRKKKRVKKSMDDPYRTYEILKQHIIETAKSHEEYETRIRKLCDRLGI